MWTWIAVFAAAFLAEFMGDWAAVYYQQSVRKLWRPKAVRWAGLLATLGLVDLGIIAKDLPFTALAGGVVLGSMAGTYSAVTRQSIKARLRKKKAADAVAEATTQQKRREEKEKEVP